MAHPFVGGLEKTKEMMPGGGLETAGPDHANDRLPGGIARNRFVLLFGESRPQCLAVDWGAIFDFQAFAQFAQFPLAVILRETVAIFHRHTRWIGQNGATPVRDQ